MKFRLLILLFGCFVSSVGYAGTAAVLTEDEHTELFAKVIPGVSITFPIDHLPHPDFRIEWWYFTANVWDENNRHYGLQFTLFRQALAPEQQLKSVDSPWNSRQIWMAHSAINFNAQHQYEERFARGGIGQAGVQLSQDKRFEAWIDDWQWHGTQANPTNGTLKFSVKDTIIELILSGDQSWVKHGENGYSKKSQAHASYYYTHPSIEVEGQIAFNTGDIKSVKGTGWLDREWSSQFLAQDQKGWDWFSLQLNNNSRLMLFQLRDDQDQTLFRSGTWLDSQGKKTTLGNDDILMEPIRFQRIADRQVPVEWQLTLLNMNRSWTIKARNAHSWLDTLFPYWEGPIAVYEKTNTKEVGVGFLEMTGY